MLGIGAFVVAHIIFMQGDGGIRGTVGAYLKSVIVDLRRPIRPPWMPCSRPLQRFSPVLPPHLGSNEHNQLRDGAAIPSRRDKNILETGLFRHRDTELARWCRCFRWSIGFFWRRTGLFGFNIMLIASIPFSLLDWQFCIVSSPLGPDARSHLLASIYC